MARYLPSIQSSGAGGGPPPPQTQDHQAPSVIVGNALNGDTLFVCDVLDPGDGTGIAAALASLAATGGDVWIRSGTYDLGLSGLSLVVPGSVTVRGGGAGTIILGSPIARTVFDMSAAFAAAVEQMDVRMPSPAAGAVGAYVIALGVTTHVHHLVIRHIGATNADESLLGGIGGTAPSGCQISNTLSGGPVSAAAPYAAYDFPDGSFNALVNNTASGCDVGLRMGGIDQAVDNLLISSSVLGAILSGERLRVTLTGRTSGGNGVDCTSLVRSNISALLANTGPVGTTVGVEIDGACEGVTVAHSTLDAYATGLSVLAGALRSTAGFNYLFGNTTPITNLGTDTESAHNQV